MSVIGRGTKSLRKQDVAEQKSIALGLKKLVFAHKANAGEAGINVTSLVAPPEMTANGFVNPSTSAITRVNIYQNKNNIKIVSSLAGLLVPYLSYTVNSSTYIAFKDFTAAQDEIFTVYLDDVPTTSLSVVDGAPIIASGTLLAGQTDFNIGTPIEINKYASQQIGAVMVYVDRGLQYRKVGNVTSGDGDYIEVPVAGGLGSLIRFDASGVDRFVTVVSNGVVAERPSGSMAAMIENVQGQIDQMVPTVAALAGVPESTFQIAPNNVDLKQFGDTVLAQQADIDDHEYRISNIENNLVGSTIEVSSDVQQNGSFGADLEYTNMTLTITAGTWLVAGHAAGSTTDVLDALQLYLRDVTNNVDIPNSRGPFGSVVTLGYAVPLTTQAFITVGSSTNIRIKLARNGGSTPRINGGIVLRNFLRATRIK